MRRTIDWPSRFRHSQRWLSASLIGLGLTVMVGWWLGLTSLTSLVPGYSSMKFNTALCFLLTGGALGWLGRADSARVRSAAWPGAAIAAIGVLTLLEYFEPLRFGIDNFFHAHPAESSGAPGRMSGFTALSFTLLGVSIWLIARGMAGPRARRGQLAAVGVYLVGLTGVLGYIYHATSILNLVPGFGTLSFHGALGFLVASMGLLFLHPEGLVMAVFSDDGNAGRNARRMVFWYLPAILLCLGSIVFAEDRGLLGKGEAAATRNLVILTTMLIIAWRALSQLAQSERGLRHSLEATEATVVLRTRELAAAARQAETAGRQLQTLLANAPEMIVSVDRDFRIAFSNAAYVELNRARFGVEAVAGTDYRQVYAAHREHLDSIAPLYRAALDGATRAVEVPFVDLKGRAGVLSAVFSPVRDTNGTVVAALNMTRDLTAQRAAERDAEAQRRVLEGVLTNASAAIFVKDAGGRYLLGNRRFGQMTGRAAADIVGRTDAELFPAAIAREAIATDALLLEEQQPHLREVELDLDGGGRRTFLVSKTAITDGSGGRWICGMGIDITDRKAAESALVASEQRLRLTLDNAEVGLWDWSVTTGTVALDRNWKAILGYGPADLADRLESWRDTMHPDDLPGVLAAVQRHFADPAEVYDVIYRARHKEGRWRWVNSRGRVTQRDRDGAPERMMGTIADVTDRKEAEALIESRNRDLETLLHVTSHDLREPLRGIESFSRLVRDRYADRLEETGRGFLDRVIRAAGRMNGLIDDVLNLSRAGRAEVFPELMDARVLLEEVLSRLEKPIRERGARVDIEESLPLIRVDRVWGTQALFNLIGNALKFTEPGMAPDIVVRSWSADGEAGLMIGDRGPGVPAGQEERIFQLFHRAVGREVDGSGAGLAIVRQVAERHGGRAWTRPRAGGGSEFIITFVDPAAAGSR